MSYILPDELRCTKCGCLPQVIEHYVGGYYHHSKAKGWCGPVALVIESALGAREEKG